MLASPPAARPVTGIRGPTVSAWSSATSPRPCSRRYKEPKTDCLSCHTWGSWKLNKRGQDFLRYGHHFEGDKEDGLGLSEYFSIASKIRFIGGNQKLESFQQNAISIYSGGSLGKGFSYFVE